MNFSIAGVVSLLVVALFLAYYEMVIASIPLGIIILSVLCMVAVEIYETMKEGNDSSG